jgi:hypothetical protein
MEHFRLVNLGRSDGVFLRAASGATPGGTVFPDQSSRSFFTSSIMGVAFQVGSKLLVEGGSNGVRDISRVADTMTPFSCIHEKMLCCFFVLRTRFCYGDITILGEESSILEGMYK